MKKLFVFTTILFVMVTAIYFVSCSNAKNEAQAPTANIDSVKQSVARGEYLALHVASCIDCHSKRDFSKFSGPIFPGTEGAGGEEFNQKFGLPGVFYSKNITPDSATGIGTWTDDEVLRAITQGISKNGDTLFPLMPYANFNHMAKGDLLDIISYIRTLKPINNKVPARQMMMPIAMSYPAAALQPSIEGNKRPAESDTVNYGAYLVGFGDCADCHTPLGPKGPDFSKMYAGGHVFDIGTNKVASGNITSDIATGLGAWTQQTFMNKFTAYRKENGRNYDPGTGNTIMPLYEYSGMTDNDLKAIYAYLRTIKPITNKVEKFPK
jgi:mono/diheme cytochrome c family protein